MFIKLEWNVMTKFHVICVWKQSSRILLTQCAIFIKNHFSFKMLQRQQRLFEHTSKTWAIFSFFAFANRQFLVWKWSYDFFFVLSLLDKIFFPFSRFFFIQYLPRFLLCLIAGKICEVHTEICRSNEKNRNSANTRMVMKIWMIVTHRYGG